uniref:Transposase n=1 Tax=Ditylenchus dipsaci TaxID=166011 RepID=A0A915D0Z9_9BILA
MCLSRIVYSRLYQSVYKRVQKQKIRSLWAISDVQMVLRCLPASFFLSIGEVENGYDELRAGKAISGLYSIHIVVPCSNHNGSKYFIYFRDISESRPKDWTSKREGNGKRVYSLNADVYVAQLERLNEAIDWKRQWKKNGIIFRQDNARPLIAAKVIRAIEGCGWELLEHPRYSLDGVATDFHVN